MPLWVWVTGFGILFVTLAVIADRALAFVPNISQLMAPMMILVTYFQTLSMLAQLELQWPQRLLELIKMLSIFMFNIELAAPVRIKPS